LISFNNTQITIKANKAILYNISVSTSLNILLIQFYPIDSFNITKK